MKQNRPTPRNITVKLQNTGDKEKILQAHRKQQFTTKDQDSDHVKLLKSNPENYRTMEQCPHYSEGKLLPT